MTSLGKSAANRRNAQHSTGPRTAAGKAAARLNALKHGLNSPVPDYMIQICTDQYRDLVEYVERASTPDGGEDLVYLLAAHARLRAHRAALMKSILEAGASDAGAACDDLLRALTQLGRTHTYERKSSSRLARLLKELQREVGETKPRTPSARSRSLTS